MTVHGVLAHDQPVRDLPVRQPVGEQSQHLVLARLRSPAAAREDAPRPPGVELRPQFQQTIQRDGRLTLGHLAATLRDQARRELEPRPRGLKRRAAALEAIDGVLEQRTSTLVVAPRAHEHPLGHIGTSTQRRRTDLALHLAERLDGRARLLELAPRRPGMDEQLERRRAIQATIRGQLPQQPLEQVHRLPRLPPVQRETGAAEVRVGDAPAWSSSRSASTGRPWRRRSSANATSGPATQAGREREKSSTDASSIVSASPQRPRQRSTAPYSARQNASM